MRIVKPFIGFFFCPSIEVPPIQRASVKALVKARLNEIDPDHVVRDVWNDLPEEIADDQGHIDEGKIEERLKENLKCLVGPYTVGLQVQWCYVVRDGYIHCFHCYGLIGADGNQVLALPESLRIPVLLTFSWESPLT